MLERGAEDGWTCEHIMWARGVFASLLLASLITACSSLPRNPVPQAVPATPAPAAAIAGAATTAPGDAPVPTEASLRTKGYKTMKRGDQTLFCRKDALTGTRFATTVCLTAEEIRDQEARAALMMHSLDNGRDNRCNNQPCANP
jgi:hypothetical protein